jgi:thioredoxin-like negative regulator of GroEL
MQAAEHLMRLREIEESQQIVNKILEKVDRYPRWIDKAHSLQRRLNRITDKVETPTIPSAQDPAYRLRSARILVNDKLTDKAAELLGEIIVSNDSDLHARHQAIQDFQSYGMRDSLLKLLETPELPAELQYLVIQSLERLGDCALAMREYGKLAQTESAPLQNRTDAAVALARLDQSESTHDLLLSLACHPERNSQLRTKLAWTLQQAGWQNEASQVLTELIEDPATNREARKIAERDLARMKIR